MSEQYSRHAFVLKLGSFVKGRGFLQVTCVDVDSLSYEKLRHVCVSADCRQVERCAGDRAGAARSIDVSPC